MPPTRRLARIVRPLLEISVLVTLLSGIVVLIRVITVARGDVQIAYVLLANANVSVILLSTLLLLAPAIANIASIGLGFLLGYQLRLSIQEESARRAAYEFVRILIAWTFTFLLASVFSPGPWAVWVVSLPIAAGFLGYDWQSLRSRIARTHVADSISSRAPRALLLCGIFVISMSAVMLVRPIDLDTAWAPTEAVYAEDTPPEIAQVVGESQWFLLLLTPNPRKIAFVRSDKVVSRQVCLDKSVSELEQTLQAGWRIGVVQSTEVSCKDALEYLKAAYKKANATPPKSP
jgi:hypothetical protein